MYFVGDIMVEEKKGKTLSDKIYDEALTAGFSNVGFDENGNVFVETNSATTSLRGSFDKDGRVVNVTARASILTWILGVITFPLGTIFVGGYYFATKEGKVTTMRTRMNAISRKISG